MPTLAEMLVSSGLQSSQKAPDLVGAVTQGAQLAQQAEGVRQNREKIEQQKQQIQMQKAESITDTMKIAAQMKDPKMKQFLLKNVMPGKIKALGMEEFFGPQTLEMIQTSDAALQKVLGLQLDLDEKVRSGAMTGAQAYQHAQAVLTNPEEFAMLDTDQIFAAQEFAKSETGKSYRAQQNAEASLGRQQQAQQAAPLVDEEKKVRTEHTTWEAGGGLAAWNKTEKIFSDAIKKLQNNQVKLGGWDKKIPWVGASEDLLAITDEDTKALLDNIRGGISIREKTGDPNPTAQQINTIMSRIIDPRLSNEKNIEKLQTELNAMRETKRNKIKVFDRYKLSTGPKDGDTKEWNGKTYILNKGMWEEKK